MLKTINVEDAPQFQLPFSHAIQAGDFLYVSGQVGVNPKTLEIVGDNIEEQTEQSLKNIEIILNKKGLTLDHIVKVNVCISDINHGADYNETYRKMINAPYPTRTTITGELGDYLIEIDCIAYTKATRT